LRAELRVLYLFVFRFPDSIPNNNNNNNNNNNDNDNIKVTTDRAIQNNKPDIIICNNERGTCRLLSTAFSDYINLIKKEAKNCLNGRNLD
jgi:hypothetical protein